MQQVQCSSYKQLDKSFQGPPFQARTEVDTAGFSDLGEEPLRLETTRSDESGLLLLNPWSLRRASTPGQLHTACLPSDLDSELSKLLALLYHCEKEQLLSRILLSP